MLPPSRNPASRPSAPPPPPAVLVFGYAAFGASTAIRERVAELCEVLGAAAQAELAVYEAESYEDLARAVATGEVDFAWLPPLAFVALERRKKVVALASAERGGETAFHSAIIVARGSDLHEPEDLAGARAAWVDPYSASGYVVPRVGLAAIGIDPRVAFAEERFHYSHEAVVRAVAAGRADFGATYAGIDASGAVTRGAWLDVKGADEAIRVLVRFGAIPGDVVAARTDVAPAVRETLKQTLLAIAGDPEHRFLLQDTFGVEALREWTNDGYDALRRLAEDASKRGLLEGEADPDEDEDDEGDDDDLDTMPPSEPLAQTNELSVEQASEPHQPEVGEPAHQEGQEAHEPSEPIDDVSEDALPDDVSEDALPDDDATIDR